MCDPRQYFPPLNQLTDAEYRRIKNDLLHLDLRLPTQLPPLPMEERDSLFSYVLVSNGLRESMRTIRKIAGDTDPFHWHPKWILPLRLLVVGAVRNLPGKSRIDSA